ncbi:MAG: hypothetical protein QMD00_00335 [Hadesarchaea archaeon]|nr:hypothetical protein [Hadesarchaea archaeon]
MRVPQNADEVKITHKISTEDFVGILERRPSKVIIPASVLKQSKNMKLLVDAISTFSEARKVPDIVIVSRGKPPRIIKQDWVDPHIRSLIGLRPDFEERFLIGLLDAGATSQKRGVPLSELTPGELKLLYGLKEHEWVEVSEGLRVHLTRLGATIARGAKKLYPHT